MEYYSYIILKAKLNCKPSNWQEYIKKLNDLKSVEGFISANYGEGGSEGRLYFSKANAMKIDSIRLEIERLFKRGEINREMYYYLIASLIKSADKVANTASVFGAYLKKLKASALKELDLVGLTVKCKGKEPKIFNEDSNKLIENIHGDVLYLDPPYNTRQYGANYHLLTTIAKYDRFTPKGKTGLREYQKSNWCYKRKVANELEELIKKAQFRYIFLSYNNEGLLKSNEIKEILSKHGSYSFKEWQYDRFQSQKDAGNSKVTEFLHILKKD
jgi:adenine-specific DNA-methyltransferase